eukprot:TRINITY_DN14539_c0_g1_i2.p1 TRINITY_DN14539_c0_g1~~TRINITY_DN14539_c0_g1_i2.p1  ORF type:complete len:154 (+),score=23.53 TRINITY_DN14539_c0_g1_i2:318-779(+)
MATSPWPKAMRSCATWPTPMPRRPTVAWGASSTGHDWCSTNFSKNYADIWYPVAGFGPAPSDQNAANAAATENLNKFAAQFLAKGKFIGDSDTLSIADYKCATLFWYLDHKTVKAKTGFELPPRIKTYVQDFLAACPSKAFLDAGSGFMDSKA